MPPPEPLTEAFIMKRGFVAGLLGLMLAVLFLSSAVCAAEKTPTAVKSAVQAVAPEQVKHKPQEADARQGIVLAFFGSSNPAVQAHIEAFAQQVRAAYPKAVVTLAYTSQRARAALRQRGVDAPSVAEVLARMPDQGVHEAMVQSMHVMPGYEYQDLQAVAAALSNLPKGLGKVQVGAPLLGNAQVLDAAAQALLQEIPGRAADEAVLFVGHGTDHSGGLAYPALQYALSERDPLAFVTVLGDGKFAGPEVPSGERTLEQLRKAGVKKVHLVPLLMVAGVHMKDDIMGKEEDSWASRLRAAGFTVAEVRRGLLETPAARELFMRQIGVILKN